MKSLGSSFFLLLIVAVVGGYIYFNERGPIADARSAVLLRTDPNAVTSLRLTQPAGQVVLLQKSGDDWKVQSQGAAKPVAAKGSPAVKGSPAAKGSPASGTVAVPADAATVKGLLDQVQLLQSDTTVAADPTKLSSYGLDKPKSSLTIGDNSIAFGDKPGFDASKVYARVGNQVALLPGALSDAVAKPFADWRDKTVLHVTLEETSQVAIKAPAVSVTLAKSEGAKGDTSSAGTSTWNVTSPLAARADGGNVESFITQLPQAKAAAFLDDSPQSPAKWGLDKPLATLKVTTTGGERTLLVGKKLAGGYAAQNSTSPSVFKLPDATFGLINRPLKDWRSKDVVKLELANLTHLDVTARGSTKSYTKNGEKWSLVGGVAPAASFPEADAVNQGVQDILLNLQGLNAASFIDKPGPPAGYGFNQPAVELKLTSSSAPTPITVQLAGSKGKAYARSGNGDAFDPTVYVLAPTALSSFKAPLDTLYAPPKPASLPLTLPTTKAAPAPGGASATKAKP